MMLIQNNIIAYFFLKRIMKINTELLINTHRIMARNSLSI